jgi:hypothetical protein
MNRVFPCALPGGRRVTAEGLPPRVFDASWPDARHPATSERLAGFEPATFDLASRRSDQLSYNRMERTTGIETATPTLGTSCATSCATFARSPSPVSSRATRPYQGRADADPKGMSWAPRTRTWKLSVQSRAGLPVPHRPSEPPFGVEPNRPPYRGGATAVYGGGVSPARLERALPTSSRSCLLPLGYEDMRADTRCRTGPSAVRRRSREPCASAWLPGLDSNQQGQGSEPCWDACAPPGIGTRGGT